MSSPVSMARQRANIKNRNQRREGSNGDQAYKPPRSRRRRRNGQHVAQEIHSDLASRRSSPCKLSRVERALCRLLYQPPGTVQDPVKNRHTHNIRRTLKCVGDLFGVTEGTVLRTVRNTYQGINHDDVEEDPTYATPDIVARYKLELNGRRIISHTSVSITDSDPGSVLSISDDDDDDDDDDDNDDAPPTNPLHVEPPGPLLPMQDPEPQAGPSSQEQNRVQLERSLQDLTFGTILDKTVPKLNQAGIHTLLDLKEAFSLVKPGQQPDQHPFWARLMQPGHLSVLQLYKLHELFQMSDDQSD